MLALSLFFVGADFALAAPPQPGDPDFIGPPVSNQSTAKPTDSVQLGEIFSLSDTQSQTQFQNDAGDKGAGVFVEKLIDLLVKLVGTVALIFLVIGGFRLVLAAGNDNEIQKAKDMLLYAVIGLVVSLAAFLLVKLVQSLLFAAG